MIGGFLVGDRVRVTDRTSALHKQHGTVERLRAVDDGAYVRMDGAVPPHLRSEGWGPRTPTADNRVLLYPHECASAQPQDARGRRAL